MKVEESQDEMAELIGQLEVILASLDHFGEKVAAIKVDEAIAVLSEKASLTQRPQGRFG